MRTSSPVLALTMFFVSVTLVCGRVDASIEQQRLVAPDRQEGDWFGYSVSVRGDWAIVGAPNDDAFRGSAYVFSVNAGVWTEKAKLVPSDGVAGDWFGSSVSIAGDYAIISAPGNSGRRGSAYVFSCNQGAWTEQAKLLASDGKSGNLFGSSVSISGDYAVVGSRDDDPNLAPYPGGSAYVFHQTGTVWSQQQKLRASDGRPHDCFGESVAIDGDCMVVGAPIHANAGPYSGSAYVFQRSGGSWLQQQELTASDATSYDIFGSSVAMKGTDILVGARMDDSGGDAWAGAAYVFCQDGTSWVEQAKLAASDGEDGDRFGDSVSIDGGYAVVGAFTAEFGAAYLFHREGSSWTEQDQLIASDQKPGDRLGCAVSIDGRYIIAGAEMDDIDPRTGRPTGSAYVFLVPEPATLWVLALGGLELLRRRRAGAA